MRKELKRPKVLLVLVVALALAIPLVMAVPALAQPPLLNGNVDDFTGPDVVIIPDPVGPGGDVPLPNNAPPGTISGWDMKELRLYYDAASDAMYIGINVGNNSSTILGDADGNGDPGGTSAWLALNGGVDLPNLEGTETAAVYFDLNQDGAWDVIAGISATANYSGFSVNSVQDQFNAGFSFGALLPDHKGDISPNPDSDHPDLEFTITNWSTLPGQDSSPSFCVGAFLGAYQQDDGIGEDSLEYCSSVEPPVGGVAFPVDKLVLVAPWATLLGGVAVATLVLRKRRQA